MNYKTKNGYDYYEIISAFQKDIRRGKEEESLFWALELVESGFINHLLNRIIVIVNEAIRSHDEIIEKFIETLSKRHSDEKIKSEIMNESLFSICRLPFIEQMRLRKNETIYIADENVSEEYYRNIDNIIEKLVSIFS